MDFKEKTDLEKLLESMDTDITIGDTGAVSGAISSGFSDDTITISSGSNGLDTGTSLYTNTITGGGYNFANTSISGGPYTISNGTGISQPWYSSSITPKIKLDGEGADIEVNGWSLIDAIKKIEERLNILHPNENLESEWEELRTLGEQYRKLEQHIKDKQATWEKLKAMPPPVID